MFKQYELKINQEDHFMPQNLLKFGSKDGNDHVTLNGTTSSGRMVSF
jgi:hypothetical protein